MISDYVILEVDTKGITDIDSFHSTFAKYLNFPNYYGRNKNAMNDCLRDIRDSNKTVIRLINSQDFIKKYIELFGFFASCVAFVNNDEEDNIIIIDLR